MTLNDELFAWVEAHKTEDPARLRLKYASAAQRLRHTTQGRGAASSPPANTPTVDIPLAILQVECRRKYAAKFPDTLRSCPKFVFPTALSAEQATGDLLARWHASLINPGERVIDLTAGLGIDDMHIARRASTVTSVERNPLLVEALVHNCAEVGIASQRLRPTVTAVCADCREYIKTLPGDSFDTVFIDPARRADDGSRVYDIAQCEPDVIAMLPKLRRIAHRLIVKLSPMLDITNTIQSLRGTATDIYAVGTPNECKELVAVVNLKDEELPPRTGSCQLPTTSQQQHPPRIHAVTLTPDTTDWLSALGSRFSPMAFTFTRDEELAATATYGTIQPGDTLIEPYPALMKAAPFRLLSERLGLTAISPNSHLYFTSQQAVARQAIEQRTGSSTAGSSHQYNRLAPFHGMIGREYTVEKVLPYASSVIKRLHKDYPVVNITARNFPLTAAVLRAKLRVRDGDPNTAPRLFATTDIFSTPIMIIAHPNK